LRAALVTTRLVPLDVPLHLICGSKFLVPALTTHLASWEDSGWIGTRFAEELRALVSSLRRRCAPTYLKRAGTDSEWGSINRASLLLTDGAQRGDPHDSDLEREAAFDLSGVRLALLTQKLAYAGIRATAKTEDRRRTVAGVAECMAAMAEAGFKDPRPADLWRSIRQRDLQRPVSDFLWKAVHSAHRIGPYWTKIPGYEDRARCAACGEEESLFHILLACRATGQSVIWELAQQVWERKKLPWEVPALAEILSIGSRFWTRPGKRTRREGASRLWRILISESAFLIWKLRCERVIAHADEDDWQHSAASVRCRWLSMINLRLHRDKAMTHRRFGRIAIPALTVLSTWNGVIHDESALPRDWTTQPQVLVGISLRIPLDAG
ncbi:ribonuclease H-like protein, partial [Fomitopsis serialis]|uniref:ribonuclease H-like protein n=1 Tax=Fomitopsis serialis TaxID=139415 RepID=UPI002008CF97